MHLNSLENKIVGFLKFETESPLHVGSGAQFDRRLLIRQPDGTIVIPSSTWKGTMRPIVEKLSKTMNLSGLESLAVKAYKEKRRVTYDLKMKEANEYLSKFKEVIQSGVQQEPLADLEELKDTLLELGYTEDEIGEVKNRGSGATTFYQMAEDYLALHCPIGRLFGNNVMAGKLRFFDTFIPNTLSETKPGVGIDRSFGGAKPDILYFTEVIPKGTRFQLTMIADNLKQGETDSNLLAGALEWIKELGIQIGARKSVGLGELTLLDSHTVFYVVELKKDENGIGLANPMKNGLQLGVKGIIDWLTGQKA